MSEVRRATTDEEIRSCWAVLNQLRPDLSSDALVPAVRRMEPHGFRLAYVADAEGVVRAVAGYRVTELLRTGLMLEVDDLVTDAGGRSRGHGHTLMAWLMDEARRLGCSVLELDSGVQRHAAHRFYFREGMNILGYHFTIPVAPASG